MDFFIEFAIFVAQALGWYLALSFLFTWILKLNGKDEKAARMNEFKEKLNEIVHRVSVEKHGDVYFWFDEDDGEFLGQGLTEQECVNHIKQRFPQHLFLFSNNLYIKGPDWTFQKYTVEKS